MLRLGEKIIVIADSLEQNLPIGQYGYIIAYDRNADNIFDYVVRVPKDNKHYYVPAEDIELEEVLLRQEADRIEKEALLDYALATKNEEMFRKIMNGDSLEAVQVEQNKEVQSSEEFIKQIGLKAWI
ncbi:ATPase [Paenibacillus sp. SYP-B3998]|uniref:ATPase n=1 Tax=Paenibacillus sp. SYP-B3998 TaxID=2678564 RepID=A0A6G4A5A3_9BACL|nr:ATPase [Paenibacillus sp. SYP-B3998]NEW09124.1 ATPase [Paenibacillus sp. SYP-B3998]